MKRLSLLLFFVLIFVVSSCHDDNRDEIKINQTLPIVTGMMDGTWHVTKYIDHGDIKTNNFTGFNFTFGPNAVITAANSTASYTGTWTISNDQTGDTSSNNPIDFNIEFLAPAHFADITDDWDIITRTANKIEMVDIGTSGSTDYITFEKN